MKFTQIIVLAFFSISLQAQTGVHPQQYTTSAYIYNKDSVYMPVSFSTGYSRMAVVHPITKHWSYLNTTNYNVHLGPFVMKNSNEGVMIYSSSQKVYKTIDGWKTLKEISNVAAGFGLQQVAISNAGYIGYESQKRDLFFSQTGDTWTLAFDGSSGVNALRAKGNKVILFTGATDNYISTDGGRNFVMESFGTNISGSFVDLVLLSEDTFILASSTRLYKSFDGGDNWTSNAFPAIVSSIAIKDTLEMYITTPSQNYYTKDGGATWQTRGNFLSGPAKFIGKDLYAFPDYRSTDEGATWESFMPRLFQNNVLFDIYFRGNNGFVGKAGGKVTCSKDRGRSFDFDITIPGADDIMAVYILKNGDYMVGDRKSQVYYSTDKGKTWSNRYANSMNFNAVKFSSSSNDSIIVQTRLGQPLVSTNHGSTFNFITAGGGTHTQTVKPSGQIIDAGGWFNYSTFTFQGFEISELTASGSKTVLDTFLVPDPTTETVVDIVAADNMVGYLMTYNTTSKKTLFYKTTNGFQKGSNILKSSIPLVRGSRMHVLSKDTIIVIAEGYSVYYRSYDGGSTWNTFSLDVHTAYPSIYPSIKKAYFFSASQSIFTLSTYGLYLDVTDVGNSTTGIESLVNQISGRSIKIYPNPASTNISIDLEYAENIQIFDNTGKLIATYSDTKNIDISSFSTGMFFIQVSTEGTIYSGKFIKQ